MSTKTKVRHVMHDNLVHKHAAKFNICAVHTDRKKAAKRGAQKHKNRLHQEPVFV